MNIEKFDHQIRSVKQRISNLKAGSAQEVCYSVFFTKDKIKDCILNRVSVTSLSLIRKNLVIEEPDIVRIEIYETEKSKKILWVQTIDVRDNDDIPAIIVPEVNTFNGLGEAEVNQMVEAKFAERQRELDLLNLQNELEALKNQRLELLQKISKEEKNVLEAYEKIDELEEAIKLKSGLKYYAGILGDLLEGFGIPKENIGKPMAALMGISDKSQQTRPPAKPINDSSGIVEDEVVSVDDERMTKRNEIITLITQFLETISDNQLANIFTIFSAIESNPNYSQEILEFIKTIKNQ